MALSDQTSFRLIGGGGVRGASGGAARVLSPDPALDFFAAALRRHRSPGDLVRAPDGLWSADPRAAHAPGLLAHLLGASDERIAGLSDLLLVLSADDWARAAAARGPAFGREVGALLSRRFADWTAQVGLARRHPDRPLQVRLLCDGSEPMGGERLGLRPGEFVTGLLPNLYAGPGAGSRALLAVHLNLPGHWTGYREVARLYDDQDLLTVGGHWLDSAQVPGLGAPALYRLRFDEDDGLVHLLSPELGPSWRLVRHGGGDGPTIFAIHPPSGEVLAWLVLEVLSAPPRPKPATVVVVSEPTIDQVPRLSPQVTLDGPTQRVRPEEAPPAPLEEPTARARFVELGLGGGLDTAAPQAAPAVGLGLREAAVLLQRVHFPDVMQGYEVYVDSAGRSSTFLDSPAVTLRVIGQRVALVAHKPGLALDGAALSPGQGRELQGDHELRLPQGRLQLEDLRGVRAEGWPYLYALRLEGALTRGLQGERLRVGRDPACRVRLPDDPHNDNILWRPEAVDGAVVRARGGAVPKARFATDSIMVAQQHVEIEVGGEEGALGRVRCVADHCAAWVRAAGRVTTLSRRARPTGPDAAPLQDGAQLFVGNTLLEVIAGEPLREPPASGTTLAPTPSMLDLPPAELPEPAAALPAPAPARGLEPPPSASELGVGRPSEPPVGASAPATSVSAASTSTPWTSPSPVGAEAPAPALAASASAPSTSTPWTSPSPVGVEAPAPAPAPATSLSAPPTSTPWTSPSPAATPPSPATRGTSGARPWAPEALEGLPPVPPPAAAPARPVGWPAPALSPGLVGGRAAASPFGGGRPLPPVGGWAGPAKGEARVAQAGPHEGAPAVDSAPAGDRGQAGVSSAPEAVMAAAGAPAAQSPADPADVDIAWSAFSEAGADPFDVPEPATLRRTLTFEDAPTRRGGA